MVYLSRAIAFAALPLLLSACAPRSGAALDTTSTRPVKRAVPEALTGELAIEGPLRQRVSTSPADLVIFYGGEHKGSLETCGCPKRPRGSFSRLDAYVDASRAANPDVPSVLVNAGYWLQDAMGFDGKLREDVTIGNAWMVKGVRAVGFDALNVGSPDIAGLTTLPTDGGPPLPLVSANVEGPGVNRWVIVERGGVKVGITGITSAGQTLTDVPGFTVKDPATAGAVLDALAEQTDVIVLLAYQATEAAVKLAATHPSVDVVVDAALHREWQDPFYTPANAVWVASHLQTMRLGELRLVLDGGVDGGPGRVTGGLSRQIDLDPDMPDDPALLVMQKQARVELDVAQQAMFGP
ncbi:MAG: hypothetical protein Q8P18_04525 [Pseudomonadota bacterium]|nr:hypothetical protein [Pseudomonadota bacterium]